MIIPVLYGPCIRNIACGPGGGTAPNNPRFTFVAAVLLSALLFALLSTGTAAASEQPERLHASMAENSDLWFVELQGPPVAAGGLLAAVRQEQQNFRRSAAAAGVLFSERFAYDNLWNGFSLRVGPGQLSALTLLPEVKAVYPVAVLDVEPLTDRVGTDLATALAMTGADVAQNDLGLTGNGIRVAVMDTGIDYEHPDLGGPGPFPTPRVVAGTDFVGDDFNARDPANRIPVPDNDPMDCNGHGTHVAGIVGAAAAGPDGVTGVAPEVTFGAYKVFGCAGSTFADIMIAAMEQALTDDMDVLNMSIGSAFQWPQYPTATASDNLVNAGVTVVASIGNSGATGVYSTGAPGVGEKVIGVASVDNTHVQLTIFTVDGQPIGFIPMSGSASPPTSGIEEIVYVGRACNADLPLDADPAGKVALAVRGACTFRQKALNAIAAGATAVVIHNSSAGIFSGTVSTPALGTPVVGISGDDGLFIRGLAPVDMTWTGNVGVFPSPTGGLISSFSSYGLSPDLSLKPDISAPGGSIRSTYPLALGSYATISGTSMASPHVAGAAALLLEASPNTQSQSVRGILQNSADPFAWWGNPGLGLLDNVHRQGAGLADVPGAVQSITKIEPSKLSLGESEAGAVSTTLSLENSGSTDVIYDLSFTNALSTRGSTFSPNFSFGGAFVSFSENPVTVPAGGTALINATISPPGGPNLGQYGGYIVLSGNDATTLRVPYAGFVGDYQDMQVLVPVGPLPALAFLDGNVFVVAPSGQVFTMEGADVPFFLVHLEHQVRRLRMEVFAADSGRSFQRAAEFQYVGRNSAANSFFALPWNGETTRGRNLREVPDGNYVIVLSVQKALGDDDNPDHWENVTSVPFTIDRP